MTRPRRSRLTAEAYARLPHDGLHDELVRGRVVREPQPCARHGLVCSRVNFILQSWAEASGAGLVFANDTGFVLARDPDTVRGPDVAFLSAKRLDVPDWDRYVEGAPDLAVDVLSSGNRRRHMEGKVRDYLAAGAGMVWVIDPRLRRLHAHTAEVVRVFDVNDTFEATAQFPGLRFAVRSLFASPAGSPPQARAPRTGPR